MARAPQPARHFGRHCAGVIILTRAIGAVALLLVAASACDGPPRRRDRHHGGSSAATSGAVAAASSTGAASAAAVGGATAVGALPSALVSADPRRPLLPPHAQAIAGADSQDALLALLPPYPTEAEAFLRQHVGPDSGGKSNQGNPALAHHAISRQQCLTGLAGITLQTPVQRERCGGHDNMVPIYPGGDREKARVCIDIFEYPNKTCELPFVWTGATMAHELCKRAGKRLCRQPEWTLACEGDPAGGKRRVYAYGDSLDLTICNTNKSAKDYNSVACAPDTVKSTWETCATNTEPVGAYPRCRSRFGVFDLHGNVAEAMSRYDFGEGKRMSQLKGSAFFYVDVARQPGEKPSKETYPDHCRYDPRWHVQGMNEAWHVNYHLGFRCCIDVEPAPKPAKTAAPGTTAEGSKNKP